MATCYIVTAIEQEIESVPATGYAPFYYPAEGGLLLFYFTDETFTQVLSALINGAYMTYGDGGMQVIWNFLQNVEYPVSFCESLISCIESDLDVRAALTSAILSSPSFREYISNAIASEGLPLAIMNQNMLKSDACEFDFIFNQVSTAINLLDTISIDIFEAVEVGTNSLEHAQITVNILGLGTRLLVIDTLLQLGDKLVEDIFEEYSGAYDTGLYDELRCELFCRVNDSCVLTFDDVIAFYTEKLAISMPTNPFEAIKAIAQWMLAGDFPSDAVVFAMHLFVANLIKLGEDVLGINFSTFALRVLASGDTGDNDWETLCEECTEAPNVRLEVDPAWPTDMLEFISNVDDDTSIWRVHRRYSGHYATGAYRSVGLTDFYLVSSDIISGTSWNIVGTGAGNFWGGGWFELDDIPCYLKTVGFGFYGVDSATVDEVAEITISRNPCPVWFTEFGQGNINLQNATRLEITATISGGSYWIYVNVIAGAGFTVSTLTPLTGYINVGYRNAANTFVSGLPPIGGVIRHFQARFATEEQVIMTGSVGAL